MSSLQSSPLIPYPWQQASWQSLLDWWRQERLPHALLLTGQAGIGKRHLAEAFAQLLLCDRPQSDLPCGTCKSCLLNVSHNHPDFSRIEPEDTGKAIKVDQIRALSGFLGQTAQQGAMKVVVLDGADALNINAANALLKGLEEPADKTLLILISSQPGKVLATIRSRCQLLQLPLPTDAQVVPWLTPLVGKDQCAELLECARGAPLAALRLFETDGLEEKKRFHDQLLDLITGKLSAVEMAIQWQNKSVSDCLLWMQQWLSGGIKRQVMGRGFRVLGAEELIEALTIVPAQLMHRYLDKITLCRKQLSSGANPNKQLLLEDLLLDWTALHRAAGRG